VSVDDIYPVPAEVTAATDIVAVGGAITADSLLWAYRQGMFPMATPIADPEGRATQVTAWYSPAQRAVLRWPGMHVSRSLRRSMRGFQVSYDEAFDAVLDGCADPSREHGWIDQQYRRAYRELYERGQAHSVEVWRDAELAGGLVGVSVGGVFCADSKFHRVRDASKAAVAALSARVFDDERGPQRLIDAQWLTDHLASLGFEEMPRIDYLGALGELAAAPPVFGGSRSR